MITFTNVRQFWSPVALIPAVLFFTNSPKYHCTGNWHGYSAPRLLCLLSGECTSSNSNPTGWLRFHSASTRILCSKQPIFCCTRPLTFLLARINYNILSCVGIFPPNSITLIMLISFRLPPLLQVRSKGSASFDTCTTNICQLKSVLF